MGARSGDAREIEVAVTDQDGHSYYTTLRCGLEEACSCGTAFAPSSCTVAPRSDHSRGTFEHRHDLAQLPPLRRGGGLFLQSCALTVERPRGEGELTVMVAESEKYRRLRERAISGVAYMESEQ